MQIITSNAELCRFIPNTFAPVAGETPLYEKIEPHLRAAEQWFDLNVIPLEELYYTAGEDTRVPRYPQLPEDMAPFIIAAEAYRNAIDSLNLVLTANGFGIVSNDHVAPASKERTDHLKESLLYARDEAIARLVRLLDRDCDWSGTVGYDRFHICILPYGHRMSPSWTFDTWQDECHSYRVLEDALADKYISRPLYQVLRSPYEKDTAWDDHDRMLLRSVHRMLSVIEPNILKGQPQDQPLRGVVDYIRKAKEQDGETAARVFDLWRQSPVAAMWEDHSFKNDKEKGGVWL